MNKHNILTTLTCIFLLSACEQDKKATEANPAEPTGNATTQPATGQSNQTENNAAADETLINDAANGIDQPLAFSLTNLDGELVHAKDFRGKWLVLNYWATWCAPCRDEMPELVKFQQDHADTVQVIGIAYEDAEIHKLKSFAADFNVNYPLLTIDVYNPPKFAEEGGLGLPTTIVYNPEGMRHKKHMGPIDAEGLVEMIQ